MNEHFPNEPSGVHFRTTHWSVVLAAGESSSQSTALETLCRTYWYPLYGFIRRRGYNPHEAQDLTQEFFARLLDGSLLQGVHPDKGRFRSFLLAALKHFLAKEWRDSHRLKRGGAYQFLSWDEMEPEERYHLEPESGHSPEDFFERQWAQTVVTNALERLRTEMEFEGTLQRFDLLKAYLQADAQPAAYAAAAVQLGLSESAVKSAIHRLRRRYAEVIREEVANTVESQDDVEAEIRRLIQSLAA